MAQLTLTRTRTSAAPRLARLLGLALLAGAIGYSAWVTRPFGPALNDFGAFIEAGRAARTGQNPYGVYPLTYQAVIDGVLYSGPNLNPPVLLPLFELLARFEPFFAFRAWYVISLALYALALVRLFRVYPVTPLRLAFVLALAGLWETLLLGQMYLPLAALGLGAWLALRAGRWAAAGLLMGLLVAVKPQFAVWPLLLLLAGHGRVSLAALGTAGGASLVPLLRYGPTVYRQWLDVLTPMPVSGMVNNPFLMSLTGRWGAAPVGLVAGGVLVAVLALWAWRTRPGVLALTPLALVAAVLAAPVMWMGYTLVLVPAFLHYRLTRPLLLAAALLCVPVPALLLLAALSPLHLAVFGTLYPLALLLLLVGVWRQVR
jgi:hypothetical protein